MPNFSKVAARFIADENAATAIEYGLIAGLMAVTAIVGMVVFGNSLTGIYEFIGIKAGDAMDGAG